MRLFRRRDEPGAAGLRGTAVVQSRQWASNSDSELLGSAPHLIDLEVRVEGREPYRVQSTFEVPRKFWSIARGLELPVIVDAQRSDLVKIDWKAFEAAGGEAIVDALGDQYRRDAVRTVISNDPAQRAGAISTAEEWLGAAKGGIMAMGDFVGYLEEYVEGGFLTREEADSFIGRAAQPAARPTAEAYPPVEGVDYEMWIAATAGIPRDKVPRSEVDAYYVARGFPVGRINEINAAWYERVQTDESLRSWFLKDTARG